MSKIEVNKIMLKIGKKKEIKLSLEEARELQKVLTDLLGMKDNSIIIVPTTPVVTNPYPVPTPYRRWVINPWVPYEGSNTSGNITISNIDNLSGKVNVSNNAKEIILDSLMNNI